MATWGISRLNMRPFKGISSTVLFLGIVSFFNDLAGEMIYPIVPLFAASLGAGAMAVGLIEGLADTTASLLKLSAGVLADRSQSRKPLVVWGYSLSTISKPLLALAGSWFQVLLFRFLDRAGKGVRSSPRDALISDGSQEGVKGRSFGIHQGFDHAGAVLGPVMGAGLMLIPGMRYQDIFLIATIPAAISVWILVSKIKETPRPVIAKNPISLLQTLKTMEGPFRWFLLSLFIFCLALSSDALILLYLSKLGFSTFDISLLWAGHSVVKMIGNFSLGGASDRYGERRMLLIGWGLYAIFYGLFAIVSNPTIVGILFLAYGTCFGFIEPAEKALVSRLAPPSLVASAYGLFHFTVGMALLPASFIFGLIWEWKGVSSAFFAGSVLALIALCFLFFTLRHGHIRIDARET